MDWRCACNCLSGRSQQNMGSRRPKVARDVALYRADLSTADRRLSQSRILIDQTRLAPPWLGVPRAGRPPKVQEEDEGRSRLGWVLREIGVSSARAEARAAPHAESTNGTC